MTYIGALDQGTSSTRFMIFDADARVIASHQLEHKQIFPNPGWVEHDGAEIWARTQEVIAGALAKAELKAGNLNAIGITNQRETTIAWDVKTGKPLHNALVWQDTRTAEFMDNLSDSHKELIIARTGLAIAPYFSASKMKWLIDNVPAVSDAVKAGTARIGTIDSWILWNLSGGTFATDVTNASRTALMNLETLDWDPELLALFAIPRSVLADIKPTSHVYAKTTDGVAIAALVGDQQGAMIGQTCFDVGDSKTTYGTGNFALLNTGTTIIRSQHGLLTTVCYKFGDSPAVYALEGSVAVTGSAIQWLRDQLGVITSSSEIEALASSVDDNGGVYFVPAFSGLFAPYWRSDARGVIVGLSRASTKAHLARAALEAIAYQTRDVLDAMSADSKVALTSMRVDGGATANNLLMQIQSDVMGIEIIRPEVIETTALGAAYAAGIAVGVWQSQDDVRNKWRENHRWSSTLDPNLRAEKYAQWTKAVQRTLNWIE
ncbi:GlpK Glycerol kinase [Candidatus Nanopelagicaceae bacterium]